MTPPILVPLDASPLADAAVPYAATLARVEESSLELLAVAEPLGPGSPAERLTSLVREGLRSHLHGIAERLRGEGLSVEVTVREGYAPDVILAQAGERPARLVVMTTRGRSGMQRWLMGSVADKVARQARCPVLLVRPPATVADAVATWRPKRLLVPLDGSPLAEQALPLAFRWAEALKLMVMLVRAEPWLAARVPVADGYVPNLAAWEEQTEHAAEGYLAEVRQQAPDNVAVRTLLLRGEPAACLTDFVDQGYIDLIVMTSHGRGGLQRLVMGSIADRLMRHGPAVCIVRPTAASEDATPAGTAGATEGEPPQEINNAG
jgi:nucleotide-binding universal stress UspA family protein